MGVSIKGSMENAPLGSESGESLREMESNGQLVRQRSNRSFQAVDVQKKVKDKSTLTVDEAVEALKWGSFHWQLLIQCGLSWSCDSIEVMLLSFVSPKAGAYFYPSADQKELRELMEFLFGAATFIGLFLGSMLFGFIADKMGRKVAYFLSTLFVALFGVLCSFAPNMHVLIAFRFLVGLALGGVTTAVTLFSECVGNSYRGLSIVLVIGALWSFGSLFETAMAWMAFELPHAWEDWRLLFTLSALPSIVLLIIFPWLVESPRYLLLRGHEEKAITVIKNAAKRNKVTLPENFSLVIPEANQERQDWKHFGYLFSKKYRITTVLLWCLWLFSIGNYYGVCFVTPQYLAYEGQNEYMGTFFAALAEFPGLFVAAYLASKIGRKRTLVITFLIGAVFCLVLSFESLPGAVLTVMAVVARAAALGTFMALYVYTPEVYPTLFRNLGLGMCSSISRIAGVAVTYISFTSSNATQASVAVGIYAGLAFAGSLVAVFLPFETKGAALKEQH